MKKSNEELIKIILEKSRLEVNENQRIYKKFFKDWQNNHDYLYRRFKISLNEKTLDIGCNYGYNLIHFSPESVGVEASKSATDFAKNIGLNVIVVNLEDDLVSAGRDFDLIWCSDVIPHLISPYKFLYDCRKALKPGGRIMIQTPLMSIFNMHRSDCHFYAFNKKALLYLLEMAGYKVLKTSGFLRRKPRWFNFIFEPLLQIFGGNIWVIAEKQENWTPSFSRSYVPSWFKN